MVWQAASNQLGDQRGNRSGVQLIGNRSGIGPIGNRPSIRLIENQLIAAVQEASFEASLA